MSRIFKFLKISIVNTIRMNYRYFGLGGVLHPVIIASRNLKILTLEGNVIVDKCIPVGGITIGFPCITLFDYKNEKSIWNNSGEIEFKGRAHFGQGSRISNSGKICFGDGFGISANSTICCDKEIVFGKNVLLSWDILIMDSDGHDIYYKDEKIRINSPQKIKIGDHVWVGCRSTILKGSKIGFNCVIAAGSFITKPIDAVDAIIVSGKPIKYNIEWTN